MNKSPQKTGLKRFFNSRLFLVVMVLGIILVSLSYGRTYFLDYTVRNNIKELEAQVHSLEKKKLESMEILEYVASNAFVEEKARTELNLKKPGEQIVIVQNNTEYAKEHSSQVESTETKPLSNPVKWWYYFTHKPLPN